MFLRFAATGSFQEVIGDNVYLDCAKSTVSKYIPRVARALATLRSNFIKFQPTADTIQNFRDIAGFPDIVGAIDCTHIRVVVNDGNVVGRYLSFKGYPSLNIEVVCNAKKMITNIVARWPGTTHDSHIFNWSTIKTIVETGRNPPYGVLPARAKLLGDAGYACTPYLLTPLRSPRTAEERRYNKAHSSTRTAVEHLFGIWKRGFPCLKRGLNFKEMEKAQIIVIACAVLHNIARGVNDPVPPDDNDHEVVPRAIPAVEIPGDEEGEEEEEVDVNAPAAARGVIERQRIINQYFSD